MSPTSTILSADITLWWPGYTSQMTDSLPTIVPRPPLEGEIRKLFLILSPNLLLVTSASCSFFKPRSNEIAVPPTAACESTRLPHSIPSTQEASHCSSPDQLREPVSLRRFVSSYRLWSKQAQSTQWKHHIGKHKICTTLGHCSWEGSAWVSTFC